MMYCICARTRLGEYIASAKLRVALGYKFSSSILEAHAPLNTDTGEHTRNRTTWKQLL